MVRIVCPKCQKYTAIRQYGGERGESGPWTYCDDCGYDEEHDSLVPTKKHIESLKDDRIERLCEVVSWILHSLSNDNLGSVKKQELFDELRDINGESPKET